MGDCVALLPEGLPRLCTISQEPSKAATTPKKLLPNMDEGNGISPLPERQLLEHREFIGLGYPSLYMCKPKRGMKRDESKETYKLPHRLIEKKRRDRINECIAQLKDLLPEHLKLTTLGHLEKAVVLELTLKHLKALTALTEQQHQKIIALQNGERSLKSPVQSDLGAFHSGFQTCTKEVMQYLSRFESWTPREQRCAQLINHLHSVCTRFLPSPQLLTPKICAGKGPCPTSSTSSCVQRDHTGPKLESQPNCVPVIQRTQNASSKHKSSHHPMGRVELGGENDTDTDSGYGGECEGRPEGDKRQGNLMVKQEPAGDEAPPAAKRLKMDCSSTSSAVLSPDQAAAGSALLSSLVAFGGLGGGGSPFAQQPAAPFCLPLCFISPSAAAAYMQPFLDKSNLDKYLYPAAAVAAAATPIPWIYPGIPAQVAAAAAAASAFPCFSSVLVPGEKASLASAMSTDVAVSGQHLPHPFTCNPAGLSGDMELPSHEQHLQSAKENP
ncbi:class E basic helix-loop-helix protein 41 [Lacerta agilis]|uniref:class E basic helix-loop-helix protein 41 n=1 Tax=Lacerta agilis TaxID=80427 RepID=UPI001419C273|nr:class E basic helix-loop-helix protein 41 [Lacerta agilis]